MNHSCGRVWASEIHLGTLYRECMHGAEDSQKIHGIESQKRLILGCVEPSKNLFRRPVLICLLNAS
jgi:hypothetical protein